MDLPSPPAIPGLSWRPLIASDLPALHALTAACVAVDGGLPPSSIDAHLTQRYRPGFPQPTLGAFDSAGRSVASAAVQTAHTPALYRVACLGQVHPEFRGRRMGDFLLRWSLAQARALLAACPPDRPQELHLATESLTAEAARLYARHGFREGFAEDVMMRDLHDPLPESAAPSGVTLSAWIPTSAGEFFEAYRDAFRERPGFPGWEAKQWIDWATGDADFRADLSLLASFDRSPVGFILCASHWIVQMGVRPQWRRRGLASALATEALRRHRSAGHRQAWLHVNVNNPSARQLYLRLGFRRAGRRARFVPAS